jgi:phage tail sheath protein FI
VKRLVVERARKLVFENGLPEERDNFVKDVTTQLGLIQTQAGLESFSVTMDDTNNTQADLDDHRVNGSIVLVPTKTIEFISIDFVIANGQVTFV